MPEYEIPEQTFEEENPKVRVRVRLRGHPEVGGVGVHFVKGPCDLCVCEFNGAGELLVGPIEARSAEHFGVRLTDRGLLRIILIGMGGKSPQFITPGGSPPASKTVQKLRATLNAIVGHLRAMEGHIDMPDAVLAMHRAWLEQADALVEKTKP